MYSELSIAKKKKKNTFRWQQFTKHPNSIKYIIC